MRSTKWVRGILPGSVLILPLCQLFIPAKISAIPVFSRKYQTSCTTCHVDFPKLNDFGKAFKDAGFKFPKDDETFVKSAPTLLGAEAQKEVWPHSVWPGEIPGMPPIGLRMNSFFQVTSNNRNRFNGLAATGALPQIIPRTDFESGLFSIFTAGNFGGDIAFWVDDDKITGCENTKKPALKIGARNNLRQRARRGEPVEAVSVIARHLKKAIHTQTDGRHSRNLARPHAVRPDFFLSLGAQQSWRRFHESFVILRELEAGIFESFAEIVQLRKIQVTGGAGRLIFPGKNWNCVGFCRN